MKRLLFLLFITIMFSQCSTTLDEETTVKEYAGVYEGIYSSVQYTDLKAIIIVESDGIDKIIVKPSSKTGHPEFYAKLFATSTGNYGFEIPNQTVDGYTIGGLQMPNSEFDGGYLVDSKQLIYQLAIKMGDYTDTIKAIPFKLDAPVTCYDGIKNGDETDIDCGGICGDCMKMDTIYSGEEVVCFDFADDNNGILYTKGTLGGKLKITHNGGVTWLDITNLPTTGEILDVEYFNNTIIIVQNSHTYVSKDEGANWGSVDLNEYTQYTSQVYEKLVITAGDYNIYISSDGENWERVKINYLSKDCFSFLNNSVGYVINTDSELLKTSNGGKNWEKVSDLPNSSFQSIHFLDENKGFAVGYFDEFLSTSDGGKTWEINYNPTYPNNNTDIYFYENNAIVLGGSSYTSVDNGATWSSIPLVDGNYRFSRDIKGDGVGQYYYVLGKYEENIIRLNMSDF